MTLKAGDGVPDDAGIKLGGVVIDINDVSASATVTPSGGTSCRFVAKHSGSSPE